MSQYFCPTSVFPNANGHFQQHNMLYYTPKMVHEWFQEYDKVLRSQSNRASVGCVGQSNLIYGGPTAQLTLLKGCAPYILLPDITSHLQGLCSLSASVIQSCFGGTSGSTQH